MAEVTYRKIAAVWRLITNIRVKISSNWKIVSSKWRKVSGTWEKVFDATVGVPADIIGMFESTAEVPSSWKILNGVDTMPNLNDLYPIGDSSQGAATGSHAHQHDPFVGSTGTSSSLKAAGGVFSNRKNPNHGHTMDHAHPSVNHEPASYTIIPATTLVDSMVLPKGIVLFWTGASIPVGFIALTSAYNYFFKFHNTTSGITTIGTHTHSFTGLSNVNATGTRPGTSWYSALDANHQHSINHTHPAYTNNPINIRLIPIKSTVALNAVASGTVAFFRGSSVPSGWSLYAAGQGSFIKCSSAANTVVQGESTHTHPTLTINTGSFTGATRLGGTGASIYPTQTHHHSMDHAHTDAKTIIPRHIPLLICRKD